VANNPNPANTAITPKNTHSVVDAQKPSNQTPKPSHACTEMNGIAKIAKGVSAQCTAHTNEVIDPALESFVPNFVITYRHFGQKPVNSRV
jgi:hypothetical protein